jgi:predicted GNAT family N-acyltransferase
MLAIEIMHWRAAKAEAKPIRFAVFVDEQKVPAEIELDEYDEKSVHVIARERGRAIGTGRLLPDGHIGRMAVVRDSRGKGVGAAMLTRLIEIAQARGDKAVVLSAQIHALEFYRKHGFINEGAEFLEAGILHQAMRRNL